MRLCNVHATRIGANPSNATQDLRDEQYTQIKAIVNGFPRVVFGGDFNSRPPDNPYRTGAAACLADLYSTGPGTPGYQECDQTGKARTGRATYDLSTAKLDYIFSSEPRRWCTVTDTLFSDHHVVIESVDVT